MRILSWNINGIRTLPKYHPWNTFKSCEDILDALEADIVCFQEMKSSRPTLQRDAALPGHYHSFFSFPINKSGYSGVAVYTNASKATPLRAEEGLAGFQPKPPLSEDERVSPSYPKPHHINFYSDEQTDVPPSLDDLESEGRALVLDFGLFVLINVYCPAETTETRLPYKMNFHLLLQERVRKLVEEEGRDVMVLGDINVAATPLDHAEGNLPSHTVDWYEHPAREWMRKWLAPNGPMVDAIRTFWPDRKGMFTCWNTRLQARETNYGARIDYVLVTRGLLSWIKHGDIQPMLKGSDHCPVYVDLHDELTLESGETVKLSDAMKQQEVMQPPRIAAKYWEEFAGKQTMLSSFFIKRGAQPSPPAEASPLNYAPPTPIPSSSLSQAFAASSVSTDPEVPASPQSQVKAPSKTPISPRLAPASLTTKRKTAEKATSSTSNKKRKRDPAQPNISTFFSKPSAAAPKSISKEVIVLDDDEPGVSRTPCPTEEDQIDADARLARELSMSEASAVADESSSSQSRTAWAGLFAPLTAPHCTAHDEPTKLWTVNKPGPNKGKKFYLCSRPVGPGYDKGKSERLREEVNHEYRCNFFKWASDVKKEALAQQKHGANGS